jgi:hypothetical protein
MKKLPNLCENSAVRHRWGHRQLDFHAGTHLSSICLCVTVVPLRLAAPFPITPFGIWTQPVQYKEEWFVVRAGFHPDGAFVR